MGKLMNGELVENKVVKTPTSTVSHEKPRLPFVIAPDQTPPPPEIASSESEADETRQRLPNLQNLEDNFYERAPKKIYKKERPPKKKVGRKEKIAMKKQHMKDQKTYIGHFVKQKLSQLLSGKSLPKDRYKEVAQKVTKKVFTEYQVQRKKVEKKKRSKYSARQFLSEERKKSVVSLIDKYLKMKRSS